MAFKQFLDSLSGSPYLYQETVGSVAVGVDSDDSDKFKIVTSTTSGAVLTSTPQFMIDPSANGNITLDPNGSGATVLQSGDLTVTAGNINMPTTSSAVGVYNVNSSRFMHSYGTNNTFLGANAGNFTLTSSSHVGIGTNALSSLTGGGGGPNSIVAVGHNALTSCTTGGANTAVGSRALQTVTTGGSNTAFGWQSGIFVTGSHNVILGDNSLQQAAGAASYNIIIGSSAGLNYTTTESSNILIGSAGVLAESNVMRLGTSGTGDKLVNKCYIAGVDGVNVGSVAKVLTMASDQVGTATITAGTGISVTPGANTITIASTATAFTWAVTTVDASLVANNGYIANKAGLLTMTLPASGAIGDIIEITGINTALGWKIAQNANQAINVIGSVTTIGVGGSLASTAIYDSVRLVCTVAGASTRWNVISMVGNITIV